MLPCWLITHFVVSSFRTILPFGTVSHMANADFIGLSGWRKDFDSFGFEYGFAYKWSIHNYRVLSEISVKQTFDGRMVVNNTKQSDYCKTGRRSPWIKSESQRKTTIFLEYQPGDILRWAAPGTEGSNVTNKSEFRCQLDQEEYSELYPREEERSRAAVDRYSPIIWARWTVSARWWRLG